MNLDDVDQTVRESLFAHADEAPSGAGLLDAVRGRSRRHQVRRRTGLVSLAVVAMVVVAVGTPAALSVAHRTGGVGSLPSERPTATNASPDVVGHASRVQLAPPAFTPVTFPLTPTFTPAGLPAPTEGRVAGETRLVYSMSPMSMMGFYAAVGPQKPDPTFIAATTQEITVNGHPATVYIGQNGGATAVQLVWQLGPQWVSVTSTNLTVADVERYANGLAEHPRTPTPLPFTLALAPVGYQVSFQQIDPLTSPTAAYVSLSAPSHLDDRLGQDSVGVDNRADIASQAHGIPIRVGDYPGLIATVDGFVTVYVQRPGDPYQVHETQDGPLSQTDLLRFAAGVTP
jgi:hypothetical protein